MSNYLSTVSVHTSGHLMFCFAAREGWDDSPAQFSERSWSESRGKRDWVSQTSSAGTTEHNRRTVQGISISSHIDAQESILKATIRNSITWGQFSKSNYTCKLCLAVLWSVCFHFQALETAGYVKSVIVSHFASRKYSHFEMLKYVFAYERSTWYLTKPRWKCLRKYPFSQRVNEISIWNEWVMYCMWGSDIM